MDAILSFARLAHLEDGIKLMLRCTFIVFGKYGPIIESYLKPGSS